MALSVVMPALEMAQESGKLISWLKKEGERVSKGEMLLEVETDKAVVEIEAASDGILIGVTAQPGDVIPVGRTIAWLVQPGEAPPTSASVDGPTGRRIDAPIPVPVAADSRAPMAAGATRISPKARRLAHERGIDLTRVKGSGPGGEIIADDIVPATEANDSSSGLGTGRRSRPSAEPVTSIGRLMAERTTQSWTSVPHFFLSCDVDAGTLHSARERLLPDVERSHGVRLTHTDLIVAAVARALTAHPRLNASWTSDGIVVHSDVNVALAVAVDDAVVTAVISQADTLAIGDIALRRSELGERARAGRLQPGDIADATFTISNLGMFDVDAFTAIIVPPQAAILAVGAITDRVVALDGNAVVGLRTTLTLSCDHRVVDGARGAAFLRDVVAALTSFPT